jgi:hypothetical protein
MQRMKLHLSGVKVPKLGSLQDRVYREYLTKDNQLEAEKMKMIMMMTMTTPSFNDSAKARDWHDKVKGIWSNFLALQFNVEIPEHTEKEIQMLEYYETVVKHLRPRLEKTKEGFKATGLEILKE